MIFRQGGWRGNAEKTPFWRRLLRALAKSIPSHDVDVGSMHLNDAWVNPTSDQGDGYVYYEYEYEHEHQQWLKAIHIRLPESLI